MQTQKGKAKKVVHDMPFNNFMRPESDAPKSTVLNGSEERPMGSEREDDEEGIRERNPTAPNYKTN